MPSTLLKFSTLIIFVATSDNNLTGVPWVAQQANDVFLKYAVIERLLSLPNKKRYLCTENKLFIMSSTITFYIARHGKTLLNTLDRVQGWCDSPLTPEGIEVAQFLGAGFRDIRLDAVYSSDLRRTRQTAEILLQSQGQTNLPITEVYGFREACFGSFESDFNAKMWGNVALFLQYVKFDDMYRDMFHGKISNIDAMDVISKLDHMGLAETFEQVESRSQSALREVAANEASEGKNKNVLIIAHGMSIICMLQSLGGKDLLKGHLENAAVCKVTYSDGKFDVQSMGDMSYVLAGKELSTKN